MTRPIHIEFPGSLWHITRRGNNRQPTFHDDRDRHHILELLGAAVEKFKWIVTSYSLMGNHYHWTVELNDADTLSRGVKWLNAKYVRWFNWRHERVGNLFGGRFGRRLIDKKTYFLEALRYVVLNPVRANIVKAPEDYEWTSYPATAGLTPAPPWLAVDDVLAQFAPDRETAVALYRQFVREGIGSTKCPWDDAVGSMYVGSPEWLEQVREHVEERPRVSEHIRPQRELLRPNMAQVVDAVANAMGVAQENIRNGHGGAPRTIAAWIGCYEAHLTNAEIGAALRLRSGSQVTALIRQCDRDLKGSRILREAVDRCTATLSRKNRQPQT
jgi:putative transposase